MDGKYHCISFPLGIITHKRQDIASDAESTLALRNNEQSHPKTETVGISGLKNGPLSNKNFV